MDRGRSVHMLHHMLKGRYLEDLASGCARAVLHPGHSKPFDATMTRFRHLVHLHHSLRTLLLSDQFVWIGLPRFAILSLW